MDDKTVDLIFQGSLDDLPPVASKIVRIFTSSTFTGEKFEFLIKLILSIFTGFSSISLDTLVERNNLMSKCYPRIKDYCREKHGLEFQVSQTSSLIAISAKNFAFLSHPIIDFSPWRSSQEEIFIENRNSILALPDTVRIGKQNVYIFERFGIAIRN